MVSLLGNFTLFDPVPLSLAGGPLAAYLLVLAGMHLAWRPMMVTGLRDTGALAVGLSGLVAIGPMELFMPLSAADHFGPRVWFFLFGLYALTVLLAVLLMRPRLVIYNLDAEQLRPLLVAAIQGLDDEPRWAGESLMLPRMGVQLSIEGGGSVLRHVELVAVGSSQNFEGWRRLERALRPHLRETAVCPNPWGGIFLGAALSLVLLIAGGILQDPPGVLDAFRAKFTE
jgi:hypothetical protein